MVNSLAAQVSDVNHEDFQTKSTDGHSLILRWYVKSGMTPTNSPAFFWVHGGGMIAYTISNYNNIVNQYVSLTSVPFLAVGFRNALECPYPKPVEDCFAGLQFIHSKTSELGVDSSRIAVMGDSGGGGIVACLANYALAKKGPSRSKQILVYPMLDDRNLIQN